MCTRSCAVIGLLIALALSSSLARAADPTVDPTAWFNEAVHYDLSGEGAAPLAFVWYRRAAEAGLPEAEFNVAVMFDSGRGVKSDVAQAATWYARAATHGDRRAAYNLGQLYEAGQGVPQNVDIARAWFAVSDLPAARARLAASHSRILRRGTALSAPIPVAPTASASVSPGMSGIELVWTSKSQPESVRFFVELRALGPFDSREVFSSYTTTSSILATLPDVRGDYAWRVLTVARQASQYAASDWLIFSIAPTKSAYK